MTALDGHSVQYVFKCTVKQYQTILFHIDSCHKNRHNKVFVDRDTHVNVNVSETKCKFQWLL